MRYPRVRSIIGSGWTALGRRTLLCAAWGAAASLPTAAQAFDQANLRDFWNDPVFQRQFVAGYGVNAEIEPHVTPDEVEVLEKVRPLMASDLPKAEALLRKEIEPESSAMLDLMLGGNLHQQGKMDAALASYERAVAKFPSFRRAWRNIGFFHVQNGNHDEAIRAFTRMVELGGGDGTSYGLLGYAYAARKDYQPAEAAFRNALLLQPEETRWRLGLTSCVIEQKKFEDAATLLDALIERYPAKSEYWLHQAQAYLGMDRPLAAAENLEIVARLGQVTVESLMTLGDIYVREDLMDLAASAYRRAIDLDPDQSPDRPLRATEVLAARGAIDQAQALAAHLREAAAARMSEEQRRKLLKLEARLAMAEGSDDAQTLAMLEEIVQHDPLDGEALLLLGDHYDRQNEPDRAILYFERAQSIEAFEARAMIRHARTLVRMSRFADAVPILRRVQQIQPQDDIKRYLDDVERASKAQR